MRRRRKLRPDARLLARPRFDTGLALLNGADYPLPGVVPLISPRALGDRKLLNDLAVEPLQRLRDHNVLLFDFVLKRSVSANGHSFATTVFETAPFFARPT